MARILVDTSYFIAALDPRDSLHALAIERIHNLIADKAQFIVPEPVIFEVLAYFARADQYFRLAAVELAMDARSDPTFSIVSASGDLLDRSLHLYRQRPDQPFSLCDCVSMEICRDLGITEVLTADTDFEREGFTVLLMQP